MDTLADDQSGDPDVGQPVDPDISSDGARIDPAPHVVTLLLVVAAGGILGSLARWGVAHLLPTPFGSFPSATLTVNVVGSVALGVLMARLAAARGSNPYLRPFVGVGVLGGFTTFSTFATDLRSLLAAGHVGLGAAYLLVSVLVCLLGTFAGLRLGRLRS